MMLTLISDPKKMLSILMNDHSVQLEVGVLDLLWRLQLDKMRQHENLSLKTNGLYCQ
jgi:hypothetical protein